jgi:hypothetical protein
MTAHFVNLLDELRRQSLGMAAQVEDMLHEAGEVVFDSAPLPAPSDRQISFLAGEGSREDE